MRIIPVLLAIAIGTLLYLWVVQRDTFYAGIGVDPAAETEEESPTPDQGVTEDGLIRVVAMASHAEVIDTAVVLRGQTQAMRQVDVRAETSATVISEPIRKGSFVEAGQILCELDPGTRGSALAEARARLTEARARKSEAEARVPEAKARLAEAEAWLTDALTNENAAVRLSADGFASDTRVTSARATVATRRAAVDSAQLGLSTAQSGIEAAEAGIESAQAAVASAEKEIERLTIRAPFAGLLESDTAELGALLQPGALCATVLQLDPIKLVAFVPETEVDRVEVGAQAGGELASGKSERVTGKVTFLSRSADPTTRTFRVEIEVSNPDLKLRDGQTVEILIAAEGERAHLLPASALTLNDEGTLGIRTVDDDGVVDFLPVTLMRDTTRGVWLTGLPDEINVIIVGQEYVTRGVTVAPTFRESKT